MVLLALASGLKTLSVRAMTRPLYHEQGTQLSFQSAVVAVQGQQVALSETAFYPEGGGQNGDAGVWSWEGQSVSVLDTRKDKASGTIWHLLEGQPPALGTTIHGEVDRERRWKHMQRHSGEHLLAQAFKRVNPAFQVAAVSMGSPECHLDLLGDPSESDVRAAEQLLRETLGRTELLLETPIVPEAELPNFPLRRETKITGQVRLVIFQDSAGNYFDVSACGGTHVPRASQCAPVVVLRTERIKGGLTRVTFMAGEEASAYLARIYREAKALSQGFSVPVEKLPERVAALSAERDTLGRELDATRALLARLILAGTPVETVAGVQVRFVTLPSDDLLLPTLTSVVSGEVVAALTPSGRCGIGSGTMSNKAGEVLRSALAVTGGKGGGKPDLAQGSCEQPKEFINAVKQVLSQQN